MDEQLSVMLERLKNLEDKVYTRDNAEITDSLKVDDALQAIYNKVNIALIGREKVKSIFKRVDDIERLLDPSLGEEMTLPDSAKLSIIQSQEPLINLRLEQLQKVEELEPVLTSEHIKAVPSMNGKLKSLNYIQIEQEEQVSKVSEDIRNLAASYNSLISMITQQFIQWDNFVTKSELAAAAASVSSKMKP